MVELSKVVSAFSTVIKTDRGRTFKGYFGPAPAVGVHFTGLLTPVRLLSVPHGSTLKAGEIVIDIDGTRYLAGNWASNSMLGVPVCKNFVLFAVHDYVDWTRITSGVEPISGNQRTTGRALIANIGVLREPTAQQSDGTGVQIMRYRYLAGEDIQLGDELEGKRVLRVDYTNGLYYVEAQ